METWREMWLRCSDERDKKLKSLTQSWQKKFVAKAEPKRQTKLAFVNSTAKVPKSVARAQVGYSFETFLLSIAILSQTLCIRQKSHIINNPIPRNWE